MMSNDITPGQSRVREIINQNLHIYSQLRDRKDLYSDETREGYWELYSKIGSLFSTDSTIVSDPVTAQSLIKPNISHHYLEWLRNNGSVEEINLEDNQGYDVKLNRFFYDPPVLKNRLIAYEGGDKYDSTYSCLFGLAGGEKINPYDWHPTYYKKEGILDTDGGGCHRALAHVLWGEPYIKPHKVTIVEELELDPHFNNILLKIKDALKTYGCCFRIKDYKDSNEKNTIKHIFENLNSSEIKVVFEFLREPESRHYYFNNWGDRRELDIFYFEDILKDLREVKNREHPAFYLACRNKSYVLVRGLRNLTKI